MNLRGFSDRRPALATALCALLAFAFPLLAFHQVVLGDRSLSASLLVPGVNGQQPPTGTEGATVSDPGYRVDPGASAWQTEPWAELTSRERDAGDWPLWNPNQAAGTPHAANVISAVFDPLLVIVNEHPSPLTWDLSLLLAFCLGSAAMFAFLRSLGLRRLAGLAGCAAFSVAGFVAVYSNNPFARAFFYVPVLLLLVDRVLARRNPPWTIALGVALAGSVLVGMPEVSFFVVATAVLYALYRLFTACPSGTRLLFIGRLAVSAGLGVALAAPLIALFVRYESVAFSLHGAGSTAGTASWPLRMSVYLAVPFLNGFPVAAVLPPGGMTGTIAWIGAGALAAAVVCVAAPPQFLVERRAPFFGALAVVAAWKIYGLPGSVLIGELPFFERLIFATWLLPVLQFALAVLAAIGIDALLRRVALSRWRLAVVTAVVLIGAAVLLRANRRFFDPAPTGTTLKWLGIAAVGGGTILLAAWLIAVRPRWSFPLGAVAALVVVVEVFVLFPKDIYEPRVEPYRTPPWQAVLTAAETQKPAVDRVFGLDAKMYPDTATALGLYDVRSIDGIYVQRWIDYVREFISPGVFDRFLGGPYLYGERQPWFLNNPMFDLMGVRYVLTDPTLRPDAASLGPQYRRIGSTADADVYENRDALPRAFVVHDVTTVPDEGAALRFLRSKGSHVGGGTRVRDLDPRTSAVVEAEGDARPRVDACAAGSGDRAAITEYSASEVRVRVDAACAGMLVLSDTYFPGWTATVSGHDAVIAPTDVLFRGVRVPGGRSTVVFRYESPSFDLALWLARLATAAAIVWLLVSAVRTRRRASTRTTAVT